MSAYPEYGTTLLPWLPKVPSHWRMIRNKNIFQEVKDVVGDNADAYPLLSLTTKGIILRDVASGKGKFPKDFNTYKIVKQGDMAFCLFDIDETPRTVGLSGYDGMLTGAYTIFHVSNINPRFVYYYYLALDNVKALRPLYSGLRKTINVGTFLSTKVPIPPRDEQDQIVRFLDWKVSMVNHLINTKRREINAIDAMKRSVVSNAVTRGLNPNVPMKYSGVKWLGAIPAHWDVVPLYAMAKEKSISNCVDLQLLSVYLDDGVIPFSTREERRTNATSKDVSKYQRVDPGDFVLNNQQAWRGSVGVSFHTGIVSPAYIVLSMNDMLDSAYANYLLRSRGMVDQYLVISRGVGSIQRNIYWSALKRVFVPVPPQKEQTEIVTHLEKVAKKLRCASEKLEEEATTLEEYKTKLITDVVTGKIDVRDIEIPEYEYIEAEVNEASEIDNEGTGEEQEEV